MYVCWYILYKFFFDIVDTELLTVLSETPIITRRERGHFLYAQNGKAHNVRPAVP